MIVGEAAGVTCGNLPCGTPCCGFRERCGNGSIDAFIDRPLDPYAGAIVEGAGRREGH